MFKEKEFPTAADDTANFSKMFKEKELPTAADDTVNL